MKRYLIGLGCALAIFSTSAVVNAATQPQSTTTTQHHGKYLQLADASCHWVGGYWRHGMWHPGRKVCYSYKPHKYYDKHGYRHCRWKSGHWRHGVWYPAGKVCW